MICSTVVCKFMLKTSRSRLSLTIQHYVMYIQKLYSEIPTTFYSACAMHSAYGLLFLRKYLEIYKRWINLGSIFINNSFNVILQQIYFSSHLFHSILLSMLKTFFFWYLNILLVTTAALWLMIQHFSRSLKFGLSKKIPNDLEKLGFF